ncbi:biopolymer transporter ExbD [Kiritimatiellota bacterium B12222]|nr:biopolymer transporter ExbD [Kiritimatiellota bacterium B12222]
MNATARIQRRRSRKQTGETIAMTPMIDVVFQLLIYFVLTFEVPDRLSQMSVWRPGCGGSSEEPISRFGVHPGFYTFNEQVISLAQVEMYFQRIADLNPEQMMVVTTTGDSAHHELVSLLNLLKKSGLDNVSLLSVE